MLQSILLNDRYAHVGVAEGLDAVPYAHDELVLLTHALDVLRSIGTLVGSLQLEINVRGIGSSCTFEYVLSALCPSPHVNK